VRMFQTEEEVQGFEEEFNLRITEEVNQEYPGGLLEYLLDNNTLQAIPYRDVVDRLFKDLLSKEEIDEIYNSYVHLVNKR
jgi:hypothetical protein